MSYSVNWSTQLITIPLADLTLVSTGLYQLNLSDFHEEIRRLEWEFTEGLPWPHIIDYVASVTFGGVTLAPVITVTNGYTVEFEAGMYAVNLVGANSNIADVAVINGVSIRPQNSAGLQVVTQGSGVTAQDKTDIANTVWTHTDATTIKSDLNFVKDIEGGRWKREGSLMIFYKDDNSTEVARFNLLNESGSAVSGPTANATERTRA